MLNRFLFFLLILSISAINGQDFGIYQNLIEKGKLEEVQKSLPYLESQYPDHPFILYIKAAVESDGDIALEKFQEIVDNYTNTFAGELSSLKIAEYLYSKGLYTQTSEFLKVFPQQYPESEHIEMVFHLLKKSLNAIGENDSISFYQEKFSEQFPNSDFSEYDYYEILTQEQEMPLVEEGVTQKAVDQVTVFGQKPWVIQVGAFSKLENADIVANRLKSAGYDVEIVEKIDRVNLYLVQVVRYESIESAINIGERLQDQFGLDFRILERN